MALPVWLSVGIGLNAMFAELPKVPAPAGELKLGSLGFPYRFMFSTDSRMLAASSANVVAIWEVATRKIRFTLKGTDNVLIESVNFTHDNKGLVTTNLHGSTIDLWDLQSGKVQHTLRGHAQEIRAVAMSPDTNMLATGDDAGTIKLWDLNSGKQRASLPGNGRHDYVNYVSSMAFSPDGKMLAAGFPSGSALIPGRELKIWDVATLRHVHTFRDKPGPVNYVAFSHDNKFIVSGASDGPIDLRDVTSGQLLARWLPRPYAIMVAVFNPGGVLITGGAGPPRDPLLRIPEGGAIQFWDRSGRAFIKSIKSADPVYILRVSPNGRYLATYSNERDAIVLFDSSGLHLPTEKRDERHKSDRQR